MGNIYMKCIFCGEEIDATANSDWGFIFGLVSIRCDKCGKYIIVHDDDFYTIRNTEYDK